jgi:MOSC domain-containing protein YiiM
MNATAGGRVRSVQVGRVATLDDAKRSRSAFIKRPVDRPVLAGELGLAGDEQADHSVHGGPDKAVYLYPHENYANWASAFPQHVDKLRPGAFGENLTIEGFGEPLVAIGDRFQAGAAVLEVSEPRQPCFKFAHVFADNTMGRHMIRTGMTGWYVRVLQGGEIAPGDRFELLDRPHPDWTIARLTALLAGQPIGRDLLEELAALPALSAYMKTNINARLKRSAS